MNSDYVYINFNDMWQSLMCLWDVIMVNNMDAVTNMYTLIMNNNWYRLYFFIWYFVGVLVVLNIVVACILDNVVT